MNKSTRNKTIILTEEDYSIYSKNIIELNASVNIQDIIDKTINGDIFETIPFIPDKSIDLIFVDPPYNLNKSFNTVNYKEMSLIEYQKWLEGWVPLLINKLKDNGSIYICGDWKSAAPIQYVLDKHAIIRNRITLEREKGRGAKSNWKNCSEDIWFATKSNDYYFDVEAVKIKRKVIAPYKQENIPKDWYEEENGKFRLTYPSNLWTDITIPFWSMPENTEHPTQKPEKLLAKIILASSKEGDIVLDAFLGSGTTSVVAKKLNRRYIGIEIDKEYCILSEKRLHIANTNKSIQGYENKIFYSRNINNND